ncbi:dihydrofolate reductase family protein [Glutamicibacter uratoxydans]|uniref:dihydrofolate reductase family protein n=1 Tax=Glutamicibacter uratoxydans TaxID=43667 RepID=UPI003D6DB038
MQVLFPQQHGPVSDEQLLERYASDTRPFIRFNFISSLDGSAQLAGLSGELGTPADARVFALLRRLASVVLVGSGTVRAEGYDGELVDQQAANWREAHGLSRHPVLAVISFGLNIDPQATVLTNSPAPVLLFTCAEFSAQTAASYPQHVQLIRVPQYQGGCDARAIVAQLLQRGLDFIHAEGGPHIFGQFIAQDLVDSLCVSFSPRLVAGSGIRIAQATSETELSLPLYSVLEEAGMLLNEYRRTTNPSASTSQDEPSR